ncbi:MAG: hypothetical protein ABSF08_10445 [Candidatus Cybelea sp.]|jgi:hypothetical protein
MFGPSLCLRVPETVATEPQAEETFEIAAWVLRKKTRNRLPENIIALVSAVLLAGNIPVPVPSSSAPKTIDTVHSSVFCEALTKA